MTLSSGKQEFSTSLKEMERLTVRGLKKPLVFLRQLQRSYLESTAGRVTVRIGGEDECVSDRTKLDLMQSLKGSHPTASPGPLFLQGLLQRE